MKKDKKQHIFCGVAAAAVVGFLTYLVSGECGQLNVAAGIFSALAGGFVAACTKEFCDAGYRLNVTEWDWKDIGFTVLGALIVALLIIGLHFCKG